LDQLCQVYNFQGSVVGTCLVAIKKLLLVTILTSNNILLVYNRGAGGQREETLEPPNILINMEEPK